jgi:hypothetical protein
MHLYVFDYEVVGVIDDSACTSDRNLLLDTIIWYVCNELIYVASFETLLSILFSIELQI